MKLYRSIEEFDWSILKDREPAPSLEIETKVKAILADIQNDGHRATHYAQNFDNLQGNIKVSCKELNLAADKVKPKVAKAIDKAIERVRFFHKEQLSEKTWSITGPQGEILGQKVRGLHRVGIYVPGGAGSYPSTVIMNSVPAQIAGVKEIVAVTPCADGLNPAVAYAFRALNITEIYKIGGAQAVGLLAYGAKAKDGLEAVLPVNKIVGPANVWAALAKKHVFGRVDIDMIAGPSEITVMFDENVKPSWIAADLLSQAEHGSGYEAAIGVTNSLKAAEAVIKELNEQVSKSPKREILETALNRYGMIIVVPDWEKGIDLVDVIAPEHLEIMVEGARDIANQIENAGAIFMGPWSSEPVGDYMAGPNHVLPTSGTAKFFSPLGVYDFIKRTSMIEYNQASITDNGRDIFALASDEGFYHHADAVRRRYED
jgi:histidinol dehydrogenase